MSDRKKESSTKFYVKLIIGLLIVFCFKFIPAPVPITPLGMNLIGIFFGTIYMFSFAGMLAPSFVAIIALGYSGAYEDLSAVAGVALGSSVIWQLIALFPICDAVSRSGAAKKFAGKLMTLGVLKGRPMRIMFALFLVSYIEGFLIGAMGTMLIMFALANTMRDMLGYEVGDKWSAGTTVGIFLCAVVGYTIIPYRGLNGAMVGSFEGITGYPIDTSTFMIMCLLVGIIVCIAIPLFMKYIHRVDFERIGDFNFREQFGDTKLDRSQFILMLGIAVIMLFFVVQMFFPTDGQIGLILDGFGSVGIFTLVAIVLNFMRIDGEPVFNLAKSMKEGCPWGIIVGVGAMMAVAGKFSGDDTGITAWLNMVMGGLFDGMPMLLIIFLTIAITTIITGFFSNLGTCLIMMAAIIPLCDPLGINAVAMGSGIVMAANAAILSPGGSGGCPILFSNENVTYGKIYVNALPLLAVFVVAITAFVAVLSVI